MFDLILKKLSEPTTWRGIIVLLTSAGVAIAPTLIEPIITLGLALAGIVEVIRKE